MPRIVTEAEFRERLGVLDGVRVTAVTGPGRSGAIASVYASHYLGVPYIEISQAREYGSPILVIDTAVQTGKTLRKACGKVGINSIPLALFTEPPSLRFWYETKTVEKMQRRTGASIPSRIKEVIHTCLLPSVAICEKWVSLVSYTLH